MVLFIVLTLGFLACAIVLNLISAEIHTLIIKECEIAGVTSFPEFTAEGLLDGEQFLYYDSDTGEMKLKTAWIRKCAAHYPDYWKSQAALMKDDQSLFKNYIKSKMKPCCEVKGVHTMQMLVFCEILDGNPKNASKYYAYDGETVQSSDLKTRTRTAANYDMQYKQISEDDCIDWLKMCMNYRRETPERKVRPEGLMFQKFSSSPKLVCHATGFFPKVISITWQKDGEDLIEDVELRETLPNRDGSFQKRSILKVSPEDLQKHEYTCVIKHSSLKEDLVLKASERRILRDDPQTRLYIPIAVSLVVCPLICIVGFLCWKSRVRMPVRSANVRTPIPLTNVITPARSTDELNSDSVLLSGSSDRVYYISGDTTA